MKRYSLQFNLKEILAINCHVAQSGVFFLQSLDLVLEVSDLGSIFIACSGLWIPGVMVG